MIMTPQVPPIDGVTPLGIDPLAHFVTYCLEFYGANGIYDYGFTEAEIQEATRIYCLREDTKFYGDSADREFVRDIVFEIREEQARQQQEIIDNIIL
jgi:hypothetical protein